MTFSVVDYNLWLFYIAAIFPKADLLQASTVIDYPYYSLRST